MMFSGMEFKVREDDEETTIAVSPGSCCSCPACIEDPEV